MRYQFAALALSSLLISTTASAAEAPESNSMTAKPAAKERTYCLQFGLDTGSRINRVECKTKREWAQLGVDVDEALAK